MDFNIVAVFARGITIELCNELPYLAGEAYRIKIDGKTAYETQQNVFSIDRLLPDTEYEISVATEDGEVSHRVRTNRESALLDVRRFGAVGDGKHDDTLCLQAAINACPDYGTVYLPEGTYYTKPLFLRSNFTLYLAERAELSASEKREDYPVLPGIIRNECDFDREVNFGTWEGNPLDAFASLVTGLHVENVDIIGGGVVNGNAQKGDWWEDVRTRRTAWRPNIFFFNGCRRIRMQNLRIQNSPSWTIHPYYSDDLGFYNLTITNPYHSPNTDGFDPESCTNVLMAGSLISVGDDCIAIKSGKYYMSRFHYKSTDHITIRNCKLERGHGCVTIGSEASCGVTNVKVSQCIFSRTDRGVRVKTRRGRGDLAVVTDLDFENILMEDVHMPLTLGMFYFCDPDGHSEYVQCQEEAATDERTPMIGNIRLKKLTCTGTDAVFVCMYGLPEQKVRSVLIEDADVTFRDREELKPMQPLMMDHFMEMSGKSVYLRNVREVSLRNVTIRGSLDEAPELIAVDDIRLENLQYQ